LFGQRLPLLRGEQIDEGERDLQRHIRAFRAIVPIGELTPGFCQPHARRALAAQLDKLGQVQLRRFAACLAHAGVAQIFPGDPQHRIGQRPGLQHGGVRRCDLLRQGGQFGIARKRQLQRLIQRDLPERLLHSGAWRLSDGDRRLNLFRRCTGCAHQTKENDDRCHREQMTRHVGDRQGHRAWHKSPDGRCRRERISGEAPETDVTIHHNSFADEAGTMAMATASGSAAS
jgi:hypothetical protein